MKKTGSRKSAKRYFLATFGCQMNISDSERIIYQLNKKGYRPTSRIDNADIVFVNMCSIRKTAVDRVYGLMNKIDFLKNKNPHIKTVLTGCFLEALEQKKLLLKFDFVKKREDFFKTKEYLSLTPERTSSFRGYVPIMTGCNNFCSYCVVPYTRGREYSRPVDEIITEIKDLVRKGYKEIWLLGQNVNSYQGFYQKEKIGFAELLTLINDLDGDFWLYFTTSHPKDLSDKLIETVAKCHKIGPYFNLPVQAGDNNVLREMNRPYRISEYKDKVKKLRIAFRKHRTGLEQYLSLSTDIIVGFPNETEKRFKKTIQLMEEIRFDMAYISRYSPRPLTSAFRLKDKISDCEKKKREQILNNILRKTALENNLIYLNKIVPVLIDREDKEKNYSFGRTRSHKNVLINNCPKDIAGQIVNVKIKKVESWRLLGDIEEKRARLVNRDEPSTLKQCRKHSNQLDRGTHDSDFSR